MINNLIEIGPNLKEILLGIVIVCGIAAYFWGISKLN